MSMDVEGRKRKGRQKGRCNDSINVDFIHVNRPAFGGTVPHFHQMSRVPRNATDPPPPSFPLAFPVIWGRRYGC